VEVGPRFFHENDEAAARAVGEAFRAEGVAIRSLHAPFRPPYDLGAEDPAQRRNTVKTLSSIMAKGAAAGVKIYVVHPGHKADIARHAAVLDRTSESLLELAPQAETLGITLALENLPPDYPGHWGEDLLRVLKTVDSPALGLCFDTGHAQLTGRFRENFNSMRRHIVHFHVHDNNGQRDQHLPPPMGTIDWELFLRVLRTMNFAAPLTLECAPWMDEMPPEGRGTECDFVALLEQAEQLFNHFSARIDYEEKQQRVDSHWRLPAIVPHRRDIGM
jgi:sugar phosphate isomerase/epimerase